MSGAVPEWTADFRSFQICEESTIYPLEAPSTPKFIELSCFDKGAPHIYTAYDVILPFPGGAPDTARLHAALRKLATQYPILAARVTRKNGSLGFACQGQGFPLSVANWPSGHDKLWPQAASFERWQGELPAFVPPPPFSMGIKATDVVKGTEPIFKVRVTHMGDGSSVISASFAHILADAGRTTQIMAHLSALYRGEAVPSPAPDRSALQQKSLLQLLDGQKQKQARRMMIFLKALSVVVTLVTFFWGLTQRVMRTFAPSKAKQPRRVEAMFKPFVLVPPSVRRAPQPRDAVSVAKPMPKPDGYSWHALHIPTSQLAEIKEGINAESQHFGVPFVSTADITSSIVWLIRCKAYGLPLPTEGGSIILTAADIGRAGYPKGTVPENYLGNAIASIPVMAPALSANGKSNSQFTSNSDEDAFRRAILECACAVRRAVLGFRKDHTRSVMNAIYVGGLPNELRPLSMARLAKVYKHPVVALITERTSFKTDQIDFGYGPPTHNLALPTWPVNLPAVVSKCPTGVIVQIMMDTPAACLAPTKPLLDTIAPQAAWMG